MKQISSFLTIRDQNAVRRTIVFVVIVCALTACGFISLVASAGVVVGTHSRGARIQGHLLLFPLGPGTRVDSLPYTIDLVTGELTTIPELAGVTPNPIWPMIYDVRRERVVFVEESGRALGIMDLSGSPPVTRAIELMGDDTCFLGTTLPGNRYRSKIPYSRLYIAESLLVRRDSTPKGSLTDVFMPILSSTIAYLAPTSQTGLTYCIVSSSFRFPVTGIGTPDSIWRTSPTDSDSIPIVIQRPLSRLIAVDESGRVKSSEALRPVMYLGFGVSPDGQWCALSEPVKSDLPHLQAELILRNLSTDSILWPQIGSQYSLIGPVFSPDGRKLASIGYKRNGEGAGILIATAPTFDDFKMLHEYTEGYPASLSWSPDSDFLMVGFESELTRRQVQSLEAINVNDRTIVSVPQPHFARTGETFLMPRYQQFVWIK